MDIRLVELAQSTLESVSRVSLKVSAAEGKSISIINTDFNTVYAVVNIHENTAHLRIVDPNFMWINQDLLVFSLLLCRLNYWLQHNALS